MAHRPEEALASTSGRAAPVDWEGLARAMIDPVRISILEVLGIDGGRELSPTEISLELQEPLSYLNYHVKQLAKAGLIEVVGRRPVRGAVESFYSLRASGDGRRGAG